MMLTARDGAEIRHELREATMGLIAAVIVIGFILALVLYLEKTYPSGP